MASMQTLESPENIQYFLAILQGYSSRITKHQDAARTLAEEHKRLQELQGGLRKQIEQESARREMRQKLINCQDDFISWIKRPSQSEEQPPQSPSSWRLPSLTTTNWQVSQLQAESRVVGNDSPVRLDGLQSPYPKRRRLEPTTALEEWDKAATS